jgi:GTP cyclohydrolase IA
MPEINVVSWKEVYQRAGAVYEKMVKSWTAAQLRSHPPINVYGVPRGGVYAAMAVAGAACHYPGPRVHVVDNQEEANFFVDDIIDSGHTRKNTTSEYDRPFFALYDKLGADKDAGWVQFPWEALNAEKGPEDAVVRLIEYAGDDPTRQGLSDTPKRVVASYAELFSGYGKAGKDVLTLFPNESYDEMIVERGIPFTSFCEHHMLPFHGTVTIGYVPDQHIVGLSKLARLVEVFARRLQVQERMTVQIHSELMEGVRPRGAGVLVQAEHMCMSCRGVNKPGVNTVTSALCPLFREGPIREEFMRLAGR